MRKRLIINCDDFGWDAPATEAILELADKQLITSTTLMTNLASEPDLHEISRHGSLSKGLHLNLIEGEPLSSANSIPTLLDANGRFYPSSRLWLRFLRGKVRPAELETEMEAQLKRLTRHGIVVSHADSHQHLHQYPLLGPVLTKMLRKKGIQKIRRCAVRAESGGRWMILKAFNRATSHALRDFRTPDVLIGAFSSERKADQFIFRRSVENALGQGGVAEFMTHPALSNRADSYLARQAEYQFWLSGEWRVYLQSQQVALISYDEL